MPLVTLNDHRHYYEDAGAGEAVILLHGIENSSRYWEQVIPHLATDFRVIAPDLRGMGRSEHIADLPPSAWVDDLFALMDSLGIDAGHFYGVSLGSLLAMRIAIEWPERVRSLTVESPIIHLSQAGPPLPEGEAHAYSASAAEKLHEMHGDDWQAVMENCERFKRDPALRDYLNVGEAVVAISAPTLIVRGDIEEGVHPLSHAVELHELIPHSWLWISPHSMSLLTRKHPGDSARVFRDFVSESMAASAGGSEAVLEQRAALLAKVDLFAGLGQGELLRLAGLARAVQTSAGEVVVRQGDVADRLYLVTQGAFVVSIAGGEGSGELDVRRLGPGDFFGEMGLLTNDRRSATIRSVDAGELLEIGQTPIRALLQRDAAVAMAVATALTRMVRTYDQTLISRTRPETDG